MTNKNEELNIEDFVMTVYKDGTVEYEALEIKGEEEKWHLICFPVEAAGEDDEGWTCIECGVRWWTDKSYGCYGCKDD